MAKSSKRSRSKGNSLLPAKRFDFTMVDDDCEELQCRFVPNETNADTKECVKLFEDWASARNHHSSSTIERVPNDILLTDTALQFLEVIIHHGEIKPLGGWQAVAFATRMLGRLGYSTTLTARYQLQACNAQPEHSTIQTICAFSGQLFSVNHLLHAFSGVLRTLLHLPSGALCHRLLCSKLNTPLKVCSNYYISLHLAAASSYSVSSVYEGYIIYLLNGAN